MLTFTLQATLLSILSAAALLGLACAAWLVRAQRRLTRRVAQGEANHHAETIRLDQTLARIEELASRFELIEEHRNEHSGWVTKSESLNLNRRGQVLRLHQKGNSIAEIASALRVGQGEVKLLIKVHELLQEKADGGSRKEPIIGMPAAATSCREAEKRTIKEERQQLAS